MLVPNIKNPILRDDLKLNTTEIDNIWIEMDAPVGNLYQRQVVGLIYSPK